MSTPRLTVDDPTGPLDTAAGPAGLCWDGLAVVSKSGAFGTEGVWRDLLHQNGFPRSRSDA